MGSAHGRIFDRTLDAGIIFLVVFTPIAFGSVHVWAYSILQLTVFALLMLFSLRTAMGGPFRLDRALLPLYACFALFLLFVLFQSVELPTELLRSLSPTAHELLSRTVPGFDSIAAAETTHSISLYAHATRVMLLKFLAYFGLFFLITQEVRNESRLRRIILVMLFAGFFEAFYGLYRYFNHDILILGYENIYQRETATGTFVNRNHLAGYLGMVVFLAIGYLLGKVRHRTGSHYGLRHKVLEYFSTARAFRGTVLIIAVLTMALGIMFSLSRMGVFSMAAAFLFVLIASTRVKKFKPQTIVLAGLSVLMIAALWFGLDPLEERFGRVADDLYRGRLVAWKATGQLISDYPVLGTGMGTYAGAFSRYKPRDFSARLTVFDHAHNDYLEMLAEVGVLGSAPVFLGSAYLFMLILNGYFKSRGAFQRGIGLGAAGSLAYMALHSLTDFNMHIPANALAFFTIAALAYSALHTERLDKNMLAPHAAGWPLRLVALTAIPVLAYASVFTATQWRAEAAYPTQRSFLRGQEVKKIPDANDARQIKEAIAISPGNQAYYTELGHHYLYYTPKGATSDERAARLKEARRNYIKALRLNPTRTDLLSYLAWTDFATNRPAEALSKLEAAIQMDPNNYFNHVLYGISVSHFSKTINPGMRAFYLGRAIRALSFGLALNPELLMNQTVYTAGADLYVKRGDLPAAIRLLESTGKWPTPQTMEAHMRLPGLYLQAGMPDKAIGKYRRMLTLKNLSDRERDSLLKRLERDSALYPEVPELSYRLGGALLAQKQWYPAIKALAAAANGGFMPSEAHYMAGLAYEALGDPESAFKSFSEAVRIRKNHPKASQKIIQYYKDGLSL